MSLLHNNLLAELRHVSGATGRQDDWGISVAEVLAAHQLLKAESGGVLDVEGELTTQAWEGLRAAAWTAWSKNRSGELASPFSQPLRQAWPPGYFEHIRRALKRALVPAANATFDSLGLALSLVDAMAMQRRSPLPSTGIGRLIVDALVDPLPRDAYCAFNESAVAALILGSRGVRVRLELPNEETASLFAALAIVAHADVQVICCEPFERLVAGDPGEPSSVSIVAPPWGPLRGSMRIGPWRSDPGATSEGMGVELARATSGGQAICLVPNSFLFKSSFNDQAFRRRLLESFGLKTVVGLPAGAWSAAPGVAGAILVLERSAQGEDVLMVDQQGSRTSRGVSDEEITRVLLATTLRQDGDGARLVHFDDLARHDFNLLPSRYVLSSEAEGLLARLERASTVVLDDLVEIYRPQPTPSPSSVSEHAAVLPVLHELVVSDLDEVGLAPAASKIVAVRDIDLHRLRRAELMPGDVVVVTKGSVGKVGFIRAIPDGEVWVANQSFAILRLRRAAAISDPLVLFRYLRSGIGQELIQSLKVGAVIPGLQMSDLRRMKIMIPNEGQERGIASEVSRIFAIQDEINELRRRQAELEAVIWPDATP